MALSKRARSGQVSVFQEKETAPEIDGGVHGSERNESFGAEGFGELEGDLRMARILEGLAGVDAPFEEGVGFLFEVDHKREAQKRRKEGVLRAGYKKESHSLFRRHKDNTRRLRRLVYCRVYGKYQLLA